jgi:hypothetical protein
MLLISRRDDSHWLGLWYGTGQQVRRGGGVGSVIPYLPARLCEFGMGRACHPHHPPAFVGVERRRKRNASSVPLLLLLYLVGVVTIHLALTAVVQIGKDTALQHLLPGNNNNTNDSIRSWTSFLATGIHKKAAAVEDCRNNNSNRIFHACHYMIRDTLGCAFLIVSILVIPGWVELNRLPPWTSYTLLQLVFGRGRCPNPGHAVALLLVLRPRPRWSDAIRALVPSLLGAWLARRWMVLYFPDDPKPPPQKP